MLLLACLVTGCQAAGHREFGLYQNAYEAQYVEADALLVELAKAEREAWRNVHRQRTAKTFDPDDAAYYVESAEPPLTASIRSSLVAFNNYSAALVALGSGGNAAAITTRLSTLALNIDNASSAVEVAFKAGGEVAKGATQLAPGLAVAMEVANQLLVIASREEFRRRLIETGPKMDRFLLAMRQTTPSMHLLLNAGTRRLGDAGGSSGERAARSEKHQIQLAGWVLLIDQSRIALREAVRAASAPRTLAGSIDDLSGAAVDLRVLAEKIRAERAR